MCVAALRGRGPAIPPHCQCNIPPTVSTYKLTHALSTQQQHQNTNTTQQAREARESLESRVAALEAIVAANMAATAGGSSGEVVAAAVVEDTPVENGNGS